MHLDLHSGDMNPTSLRQLSLKILFYFFFKTRGNVINH